MDLNFCFMFIYMKIEGFRINHKEKWMLVPISPDVDSLEVSKAFEFFFNLESCNHFNCYHFTTGKYEGQIPQEWLVMIALIDGVTKAS